MSNSKESNQNKRESSNQRRRASWTLSLSDDSISFLTTTSSSSSSSSSYSTSSSSTTPIPSPSSSSSSTTPSLKSLEQFSSRNVPENVAPGNHCHYHRNDQSNTSSFHLQVNNSSSLINGNELSESVPDEDFNAADDEEINNIRIRHLIVKYEPPPPPPAPPHPSLSSTTQSKLDVLKKLNLELDCESNNNNNNNNDNDTGECRSPPLEAPPEQLQQSQSLPSSPPCGSINSCSNCSSSSSNRFEISSHESMVFSQIIAPNPDCVHTKSHGNFQIPPTSMHIFKHQGFHIRKEIGHGSYGKVYHAVGESIPGSQSNSNGLSMELSPAVPLVSNDSAVKSSSVHHPEIGKDYAIKLMDMNRLSRTYKRKFLGREINALLSIPPHDNIVRIYDLFKSTAVPVVDTTNFDKEQKEIVESSSQKIINIIMEFCPNGDMFEYLTKRHHIPEPYACKWFAQILFAVGHIHDYGFAHRDLKLENLLFDSYFNIKVTDFGFCLKLKDLAEANCYTCTKCGNKCEAETDEHDDKMKKKKKMMMNQSENLEVPVADATKDSTPNTQQKRFVEEKTYTSCGSQLYSSPELLNGFPYQGTMNDVWCCGVILFVMLYGTYPFNLNDELKCKEDGRYEVLFPVEPPISADCLALFDHIFVEEEQRYSINQLKELPWIKRMLESGEMGANNSISMANVVENVDELKEHFEQLNIPRQETLSFEVNELSSITQSSDN